MSESFEQVYDRVYPQLHNPCGMWKAGVVKEWLDELMTAYDHDIEHLRKKRFREGYEAGRRSMDAEHYAVALRLRQLSLDEDSHGNLSQIARAVWHSDFGWTQGACAALRDELVRLMGGVHDEPVQVCQSGDSDCARGDCGCGESGRIDKRDSQKAPILANSDGEDGGEVTITDELRKFVAETWDGSMYVNQIPRNLQVIAYHIDEQEHKLRKQRDGFKRGMVAAQDLLEKRTDERDELQRKLDSMVEEYCAMRTALDISSTSMKEVVAERNEAREMLDAILRILDGGD